MTKSERRVSAGRNQKVRILNRFEPQPTSRSTMSDKDKTNNAWGQPKKTAEPAKQPSALVLPLTDKEKQSYYLQFMGVVDLLATVKDEKDRFSLMDFLGWNEIKYIGGLFNSREEFLKKLNDAPKKEPQDPNLNNNNNNNNNDNNNNVKQEPQDDEEDEDDKKKKKRRKDWLKPTFGKITKERIQFKEFYARLKDSALHIREDHADGTNTSTYEINVLVPDHKEYDPSQMQSEQHRIAFLQSVRATIMGNNTLQLQNYINAGHIWNKEFAFWKEKKTTKQTKFTWSDWLQQIFGQSFHSAKSVWAMRALAKLTDAYPRIKTASVAPGELLDWMKDLIDYLAEDAAERAFWSSFNGKKKMQVKFQFGGGVNPAQLLVKGNFDIDEDKRKKAEVEVKKYRNKPPEEEKEAIEQEMEEDEAIRQMGKKLSDMVVDEEDIEIEK